MDAAELLVERAVLAGRLTRVEARQLVGREAEKILTTLVGAARLLHVPGSGSSRASRSGHYVPVQYGQTLSDEVLDRALLVFGGRRGTLAAFVEVWGGSRVEVLGLLLGLRGQGRARGGSVGATYVFQVEEVTRGVKIVEQGEHPLSPPSPAEPKPVLKPAERQLTGGL
jgi:hypothetical protein